VRKKLDAEVLEPNMSKVRSLKSGLETI